MSQVGSTICSDADDDLKLVSRGVGGGWYGRKVRQARGGGETSAADFAVSRAQAGVGKWQRLWDKIEYLTTIKKPELQYTWAFWSLNLIDFREWREQGLLAWLCRPPCNFSHSHTAHRHNYYLY